MRLFPDIRKWLVLAILATSFLGFTLYLYANLPGIASTNSEEILAGKKVWQERNCGACHQVYGLGGYLGPDLTNVHSKGDNYIRALVNDGTAVMPAFELTDQEMNALLEYFRHLDSSGKSDPRTFKISPYGTIRQ